MTRTDVHARRLARVTTLAITLLAIGCTQQTLTLSEWAERFCEVAEESERRVQAIPESADPNSLDLSARITQFERLTSEIIQAASDSADELRTIEPPELARPYHEASIEMNSATIDALDAGIRAYRAASSLADIELANEQMFRARSDSLERFDSVERAVDLRVIAALLSIEECGGISP